jgi:hypothetical protein
MAGIKLSKLAETIPVKLSITVSPDLQSALTDYTALYGQTYGVTAATSELIPSMLASFLGSDREFQRVRSTMAKIQSSPAAPAKGDR